MNTSSSFIKTFEQKQGNKVGTYFNMDMIDCIYALFNKSDELKYTSTFQK